LKQEKDVHLNSLSDGMTRVLQGKQLLAPQKLIDKYSGHWPDLNVINEIKQVLIRVEFIQGCLVFPDSSSNLGEFILG
jgi:hypothetical protein